MAWVPIPGHFYWAPARRSLAYLRNCEHSPPLGAHLVNTTDRCGSCGVHRTERVYLRVEVPAGGKPWVSEVPCGWGWYLTWERARFVAFVANHLLQCAFA